jgi:phage shock protein E
MNWLSRIMAAVRPMPVATPTSTRPDMKLPPNTILIDVRSSGEFGSGHIEGALNLPLDRIEHDITSVVPDKATPLLLYCRSGARSGRACEIVSHLGYLATRNGGGIGSLALTLGRQITRA